MTKTKTISLKKVLLSICVALLLASCAVPTVLIRGTVYDADGPLPYCSVYTLHPYNGDVSDSTGHYSLHVFENKTTRVRCALIGYKEARVKFSPDCDNKDHFDMRLQIDTIKFDRIIATKLK